MQKTKIDWIDYTWNPLIGCKHGCFYCYARKMNQRFRFIKKFTEPKFLVDRLSLPAKLEHPATILVCSMGDLFGKWVDKFHVDLILQEAGNASQHDFYFLTKNPARYSEFNFPPNSWLGASVTQKADLGRLDILRQLASNGRRVYVSFEPLLEDVSELALRGIHWVIIGAMTGCQAAKYKPKIEWVRNIINEAREYGIPIFLKKNLIQSIRYPELIQELPSKEALC